MEFQGRAGVRPYAEVVVEHLQRTLLLRLLLADLHMFIALHDEVPAIQLYDGSLLHLAQNLVDGLVCVTLCDVQWDWWECSN